MLDSGQRGTIHELRPPCSGLLPGDDFQMQGGEEGPAKDLLCSRIRDLGSWDVSSLQGRSPEKSEVGRERKSSRVPLRDPHGSLPVVPSMEQELSEQLCKSNNDQIAAR